MPPQAPAAAPAAEPQQHWLKQAAKYLAIYWLVTSGSTLLLGPKSPLSGLLGRNAPGPSSGGDPSKEVHVPQQQQQQGEKHEAKSMWNAGADMSLTVYLTESERWVKGSELQSHTFESMKYGDWDWRASWETEFNVPESVQHNGSLYLISVLTVDGKHSKTVGSAPGQRISSAQSTALLSRYMPQRKVRATKNLLSTEAEKAEAEAAELEDAANIISYYHPNLTLAILNEPHSVLQPAALPPVVAKPFTFYQPGPGRPVFADDEHRWGYTPPVYQHDFWLMKEHMNPINETTPILPLRVEVQPLSYMKFQLFATMDASFKDAAAKGQGAGEMDEIKRMLTETSPYLLVTTLIVSLLHMVFEFLAFSSDVSHWRKKKDIIGVSVRTILTNVFVQIIILLYLLDNNENTSWMILGSQGVGAVIEAWKITKAVDVKIVPSAGLLPYWFEVHDKHVLTEEELKTQQYDKQAFKIVSLCTIPLLVGYTIYSLLYESHRGWYSFVIGTLTSFVYMFGFVQLIRERELQRVCRLEADLATKAQLIINYHLKSVAHMPVKSLVYKTLTTVVDDFFSFCIKMPTLHRLACFRDDVVFVVLMYQYWIYRVDPKRANEYGQVAVDENEADKIGDAKLADEPAVAAVESKKTK